jgi:hypothetical protein
MQQLKNAFIDSEGLIGLSPRYCFSAGPSGGAYSSVIRPRPVNALFGSTQSDAPPLETIHMQTQSKFSIPVDFDFIIGDWSVKHRRLNDRLCGCTDWTEFSGKSSTRKILGGFGNVEDNVLYLPDGEIKAAAFRSFDAKAETWAIWWLDGRSPHNLDTPVIGRFTGHVGQFFAEDSFRGNPITVRFIWTSNTGGNPTWEQAFSADGGITWETNWTMEFTRSVA